MKFEWISQNSSDIAEFQSRTFEAITKRDVSSDDGMSMDVLRTSLIEMVPYYERRSFSCVARNFEKADYIRKGKNYAYRLEIWKYSSPSRIFRTNMIRFHRYY